MRRQRPLQHHRGRAADRAARGRERAQAQYGSGGGAGRHDDQLHSQEAEHDGDPAVAVDPLAKKDDRSDRNDDRLGEADRHHVGERHQVKGREAQQDAARHDRHLQQVQWKFTKLDPKGLAEPGQHDDERNRTAGIAKEDNLVDGKGLGLRLHDRIQDREQRQSQEHQHEAATRITRAPARVAFVGVTHRLRRRWPREHATRRPGRPLHCARGVESRSRYP